MKERIGWTMGNYIPPPGKFGELLTPDDIRYNVSFWGLELTSLSGEVIDDNFIRRTIKAAIEEFQRTFNYTIVKTRFAAFDNDYEIARPNDIRDFNLVPLTRSKKMLDGTYEGGDFDEEEEPYDYDRERFEQYIYIKLRNHPVISLQKAIWLAPTKNRIIDLQKWAKINKQSGSIQFFPDTSIIAEMYTVGTFPFVTNPTRYQFYPDAFWVDYTAGHKDSSLVPEDIRFLIGDYVTLRLGVDYGTALRPGVTNTSISLQGISESIGTPQSQKTHIMSPKISAIIERIKEYMINNKLKLTTIQMESL